MTSVPSPNRRLLAGGRQAEPFVPHGLVIDIRIIDLDRQRETILPILAEVYGGERAKLWLQRWRLFFLACSELFRFRRGNEWWVSHYRFAAPSGGER